jgi:hypothetical protein
MYQIKCDGYTLYDPRNETLSLEKAKYSLTTNAVGEATLLIYPNHKYYSKLQKKKSKLVKKQLQTVLSKAQLWIHFATMLSQKSPLL